MSNQTRAAPQRTRNSKGKWPAAASRTDVEGCAQGYGGWGVGTHRGDDGAQLGQGHAPEPAAPAPPSESQCVHLRHPAGEGGDRLGRPPPS